MPLMQVSSSKAPSCSLPCRKHVAQKSSSPRYLLRSSRTTAASRVRSYDSNPYILHHDVFHTTVVAWTRAISSCHKYHVGRALTSFAPKHLRCVLACFDGKLPCSQASWVDVFAKDCNRARGHAVRCILPEQWAVLQFSVPWLSLQQEIGASDIMHEAKYPIRRKWHRRDNTALLAYPRCKDLVSHMCGFIMFLSRWLVLLLCHSKR